MLVVVLVLGVLGVLDGWLWQRNWVVAVLSAGVVLADLVMIGVLARKQSWGWFFRPDNSTTKWQTR